MCFSGDCRLVAAGSAACMTSVCDSISCGVGAQTRFVLNVRVKPPPPNPMRMVFAVNERCARLVRQEVAAGDLANDDDDGDDDGGDDGDDDDDDGEDWAETCFRCGR